MSEDRSVTPVHLSDEQQSIFDRIESSHSNYFITGKAGTGKSVLLKYLVQSTAKKVAVLAPTGIAAVNVGGQTIHSFFGLDTSVQDTKNKGEVYNGLNDERRLLLSALQVLIIDPK